MNKIDEFEPYYVLNEWKRSMNGEHSMEIYMDTIHWIDHQKKCSLFFCSKVF